MDSLRLKMNIRNNKILGLNAELSAVRQELDSSSKTMKELLGERDRLEEKVRGLGEENTELSNTFDEVQKLRQRFDTINKVSILISCACSLYLFDFRRKRKSCLLSGTL